MLDEVMQALNEHSASAMLLLFFGEAVEEEKRADILEWAIRVARLNGDRCSEAAAVAMRCALLDETDRPKEVARALELVRLAEGGTEIEFYRERVLEKIVEVIPPAERLASIWTFLELLAPTVRSKLFGFILAKSENLDVQISAQDVKSRSWGGVNAQASALQALTHRTQDRAQEDALDAFLKILGDCSPRFYLLADIERILPCIYRLEGNSGLLLLARSITDAGDWFP